MRACEVEISGIPMPFRHRDGPKRNLGPGQVHPGEMDLFDALPAVESMQAVFEPVMIPGHCEEQDDAERQRHVAGGRPSHFMRDDRAEQPEGEDGQASAGESRADASTLGFQPRDATEPAQQGCLASGAGSCVCD